MNTVIDELTGLFERSDSFDPPPPSRGESIISDALDHAEEKSGSDRNDPDHWEKVRINAGMPCISPILKSTVVVNSTDLIIKELFKTDNWTCSLPFFKKGESPTFKQIMEAVDQMYPYSAIHIKKKVTQNNSIIYSIQIHNEIIAEKTIPI